MPELPEVEAARRLLQAECVGKRITAAVAADDDKVIDGINPRELEAALAGRTVVAANRLGKQLWLDLGPGPALLLHFGMTGGIVVRGKGGAHYQRYKVTDEEWPPKFVRLQLEFEDGTQWAFADSRRFGRIKMVRDPLTHPPLSALGWDPLLSMPALEDFVAAVGAQRRAIKALLLDQSFSAGIGNWVADETLYQSRIHPEQPANSLTPEQLRQLHSHIQSVCQIASDAGAEADKLPEDWLFHVRWGKGSKTKAKIGGHAIEHITVGGRTSAYVPALQKLHKPTAGKGKAKQVQDASPAPKRAKKAVTASAAAAAAATTSPALAKARRAAGAAKPAAKPAVRRRAAAPATRPKAVAPRAAL